jgi:hypothetical protein
MKTWQNWLSGILLIGLLSACAPPVTGLVQHKNFNYHNLSQAKIAILGVDSALSPLTAAERSRYSDMLLRQFREERGMYSYVPAGDVANKVGQDVYQSILDNYGVNGSLSESQLKSFVAALPYARYGILARLENTDVRQERSEDTKDLVPTVQYKDKKADEDPPEATQVEVTLQFRTVRDLSVSMLIYDLSTQEAVWSGTLNQNYQRNNTQSRVYDKDNRWQQELLDLALREIIAKRSEEELYPEAPSLTSSLEQTFAGFALNMPEE